MKEIDRLLLEAAKVGNVNEVQSLLTAGANVNIKDEYGQTPLHRAAINGHTEAVNALIKEGGADVNAQDIYRQTPLHCAADNGHTDIVSALIVAKAMVDATDTYRQTPLHCATINGHTGAVNALLAGGAHVNIKDEDGQTPLHWATINGHAAIVQALIAQGADVNIKDNKGKTAGPVGGLHTEVGAESGRKAIEGEGSAIGFYDPLYNSSGMRRRNTTKVKPVDSSTAQSRRAAVERKPPASKLTSQAANADSSDLSRKYTSQLSETRSDPGCSIC